MPHLAIDTTCDPSRTDLEACTAALTHLYVEEMATTAGHVAVTIRTHPPEALALGRAVDGPIAFLDADVRRGRSFDRRRSFALTVIDWLETHWRVPRPNAKVVFTEHAGEELMGADRVGGEWHRGEE